MSASDEQRDCKAEPNLTPLLDVVFQLITFFMLVINFSNDNFDSKDQASRRRLGASPG